MSGRVARPVEIYQIKITLRNSHPPIWRRIQVNSDITLARFHRILQRVMGWEDAHLHWFIIQGEQYGTRDSGAEESRNTKDERKYTLGEVVTASGGQFVYLYDFGDDWEHVLAVEKTLSPQKGTSYPVCLAGARACPPEDVGGISGYKDFLEAIENPGHPEHAQYLDCIGSDLDPDAFDINEVNRLLRVLPGDNSN